MCRENPFVSPAETSKIRLAPEIAHIPDVTEAELLPANLHLPCLLSQVEHPYRCRAIGESLRPHFDRAAMKSRMPLYAGNILVHGDDLLVHQNGPDGRCPGIHVVVRQPDEQWGGHDRPKRHLSSVLVGRHPRFPDQQIVRVVPSICTDMAQLAVVLKSIGDDGLPPIPDIDISGRSPEIGADLPSPGPDVEQPILTEGKDDRAMRGMKSLAHLLIRGLQLFARVIDLTRRAPVIFQVVDADRKSVV